MNNALARTNQVVQNLTEEILLLQNTLSKLNASLKATTAEMKVKATA